jgi:hypothetical protein
VARESDTRYVLSVNSSGLLSLEAAVLAPVFLELGDWDKVRSHAIAENLLQARTHNANIRRTRETVTRLAVLSEHEVKILADATATERGHLMWAAVCRRYDVVGEFAEEVLRERFLTLVGSVTYSDFDSFLRAKAVWHDELNAAAESTYKKLRMAMFVMMREAGLLDPVGAIEPVLLSAQLIDCFSRHQPSSLRFFPISEAP